MNTLQPRHAGQIADARHVRLSCALQDFPVDLFNLAETLEILDLSGNALSRLPDELPRLHRLRILFCSDNQFTELPAVLGQCPNLEMIGFKANQIAHVPAAALPPKLRWLILTDNCITELPDELGNCTHLQKLMLAGNRLTHLPESLARCEQLELLRIAANRLATLPDWLLELPRLAWLAYAGNPCCPSADEPASSRPIAWSQLELEHKLGEGASGTIHQARWRKPAMDEHAVAVKLFKGTMTSDGLPLNEMAACLQAGTHPHLIPVLGQLVEHPEGRHGLVLALIDPCFRTLAGPPSFASCTRDVYTAETRIPLAQALRIALSIASAAAHLHAQGINHGDLYGHNILHDTDGHALLGDFGAASRVDRSNPQQARKLQRIEVRAFACLLEELLTHSPPETSDPADHPVRQALQHLQSACQADDPEQRPLFADIEHSLRYISQRAGEN